MQYYGFSKPGLHHLQAGEKNQDQTFGIQGSDRLSLCLSDGCGSSPHGLDAAQYVSMLTARLFFFEFYDLLSADADIVRQKVSALLQPPLRALAAQQGSPPEEMAATLVAFVADDAGRYLCAHLGDGCILMQPSGAGGGDFSVISDASRGMVPHSTYLTMNADMMQHLKVYRSLRPRRGKFLLLTDGADDLLRPRRGERCLPCPFSGPALERHLDTLSPHDDYSAALITV